jgi:phosphohistidine swiveling domain-containing protein
MTSRWTLVLVWLLIGHSGSAAATAAATAEPDNVDALRAIVVGMKTNPRGPFQRLRWFCADGAVLAPKAYACAEHGGGRQHGQWSADTLTLHAAGYPVANVLAALTPDDFDDSETADMHFRILLLEQFLFRIDDGWILRQARFYRGAFQVEQEELSAYELLDDLVHRDDWLTYRYPLLIEAARLLPHGAQALGADEIRNMASAINRGDPGFSELRNKIHGRPEAGDADSVRRYAAASGKDELADDYERLAAAIDTAAQPPDISKAMNEFLVTVRDSGLEAELQAAGARVGQAGTPAQRLDALSKLMTKLRGNIGDLRDVATLDLMLTLEALVFQTAQNVPRATLTRLESLRLMTSLARAAYGVGLLTSWEWDNVQAGLTRLAKPSVDFAAYRRELRYLERLPGWASRRLAFYFEPAIARLATIEPIVGEFIPDRMRGSPLLAYSQLLNPLAADAMRLAGVRQQMFGQQVPAGLRALNPGVGRGVLRTLAQLESAPEGTANSIALVPETVSELPIVAGILTEHEGNALSHVQLLARNLGVPNVVVGDELLDDLRAHLGQRVTVASSPGGVVRIDLDNAAEAAAEAAAPIVQQRIDIDYQRLDLETQRLIPAAELTSADQGVRVGPKAAQVGRLTRHFPGRVAPGLAVPFGLFSHALTDRQVEPGGPTLFDWMKVHLNALETIDDPVQRQTRTGETLATIRSWFATRSPNPEKLADFRAALEANFGPDGSFGVFVRSDTNVEDLAGFTGAGINLTVPNVVGFDNIVAAMRDVWASPFTERSYGWRQGIMNDPEHVYASVLLHKSMNLDTSGVLVTADLDTGSHEYLTVVLNEGVGGGVEGQAAETLRIRRSDGAVHLIGSATAPTKRILLTSGGSAMVPASGAERLLSDGNVKDILWLADQLPGWFDNLPEEERAAAVADVEFGFLDGKLYLFQIRPFVQSSGAEQNAMLRQLDAGLTQSSAFNVDMSAPPEA